MNKEIEELYKDIPEIIENNIEMAKENEPILIHTGEFILRSKSFNILVDGIIEFRWLPNLGVRFSGVSSVDIFEFVKNDQKTSAYSLILDNLDFGECFILTHSSSNIDTKISLSGIMRNKAVKGDKSINVTSIKFSIPNLKSFFGSNIKKRSANAIQAIKGRLIFENDNYTLVIDKSYEYEKIQKGLELNGGFVIQYNGELRKKDNGNISYADTKEIFYSFDTFLNFLNGRRTSSLFINAIHENNSVWVDYSEYFVDTYKYVISWTRNHSIEGLNDLWKRFSELWKEPENRTFLNSAIHWYVEANKNSGFAEGSIVMAQTALELIYNWLLIENKKLLIGNDAINISASNKIRLLLSQLNIGYNIPTAFNDLQSYIDNSNDTIVDGPDAIVQIRNAIIHSQEEKRKKLSLIPSKAKHEALHLCIWYIELSLLYILEYKGLYFNRCFRASSIIQGEQRVPWK